MQLHSTRLAAKLARVRSVTLAPEVPAYMSSQGLRAFIAAGRLRGWSERTLRSYRLELERVERETGRPLVDLDHAAARDFLTWLAARGVKNCTVAKALIVLRSWSNWAMTEDLIEVSPVRKLRAPKEEKRVPIHLTEAELAALFASARERSGLRGEAMLKTVYFLGARASEVVGPTGLTLAAVDFEAGTARLFGKGKKERIVPLAPKLLAVLTPWLAERGDEPGLLFPLATYDTLRRVFNGARDAAGLRRKFTLHKLRHTYATTLLAAGVAVEEIQLLLGHSNITTTMGYAHALVKPETCRRVGEAL